MLGHRWSYTPLPNLRGTHFDASSIVIAIVDQPHNTVSYRTGLPRHRHAYARVVIDASHRNGSPVPSPPLIPAPGGCVPPKNWCCTASLCLHGTSRLMSSQTQISREATIHLVAVRYHRPALVMSSNHTRVWHRWRRIDASRYKRRRHGPAGGPHAGLVFVSVNVAPAQMNGYI